MGILYISYTPYPSEPREAPAGERKIAISRAKKSKSLKKWPAVRHQEGAKPGPYQDFTRDNMKSEDPAKMTYSIPDFLSRGREGSTYFPEISWKYECLGLESVSRKFDPGQEEIGYEDGLCLILY